ncbi:cytochrome c oxidase subunit I [Afifella sp. JA880]|uniref:cytochrome c oxidase subunit I n=1 Tax=Afifella sp. JA880 TaxID=2975280 RepID=UPI0021BB455C|nr:cytochrome c oxidase subunit I [Afifella sp. JA880]MCT8267896.1 cytochrome c oxidase subunit I [Afifella sp. JA880]
MTDTTAHSGAVETAETTDEALGRSYLNESGSTLSSWLFTIDHKRIAILYAISTTVFFFIGGAAATLIRLELLTPAGDLVADDTYNKLFTLHGITMIWFFLVPVIPTTLGNFLVPLMLGARDLAFPRLNLFSWYLNIGGGVLALAAIILGGVDTGWTFYTPFSSFYSNSYVSIAAIGVFLTGFSSIATGLNFIVTTHTMRCPGLTWFRLPLFIWANYATSLIMLLATPVLAMALLLIVAERWFGLAIFDPTRGGDPLLFQHLFWFYSHPAVYIMILPGMGVVSEIITCFARRRVFGYTAMVFAILAIAVIGFFVWGHHMFVSGQSSYANLVFSFLSFMVAVPSAIKVFNWTATLFRGRITFEAPMLYALGFVGLFTMGGLTGLFLASVPIDLHVHDTYFVVAHFHYIMVGGMVSAFFGGLHFWWPKITGRLYPERWAQAAAIMMFVGFNTTFFPQYILGYLGMPRRYHAYAPEFQMFHVASTLGAVLLAVAYLMPLFYLGWSLFFGRVASANPWEATGLEWTTASPPPQHNFFSTPVVREDPYNYHLEGTPKDA